MNNKYQLLKNSLAPQLQTNVPLKNHTYFKIGGPADLFYPAKTQKQLIQAVKLATQNQVPFQVLGSGSNILVTDKGFRGLIIKNKTTKITSSKPPQSPYTLIRAQSGLPTNKLIQYTMKGGLKGLASFLGLPGTIGGAIYNNSHHLDKLIGDYVQKVKVITPSQTIKTYTQKQMNFAYDYSILHQTKDIVLSATFKLKKGNSKNLAQQGKKAVQRRASTQPLGKPSSGCIFQNITAQQAKKLNLPTQSTGYLIDQAGLKGKSIGGAKISTKHANFIVNQNNATYQDVQKLIQLIKQKIKQKYHLTPKLEIFILGQT